MSKATILWQANSDFQRRFLACSARIALAGGGGGGGKTSALLAAAAIQSANPQHRAIIFRKDIPSLRHIILKSVPLFAPMRATYNKQERTWTPFLPMKTRFHRECARRGSNAQPTAPEAVALSS